MKSLLLTVAILTAATPMVARAQKTTNLPAMSATSRATEKLKIIAISKPHRIVTLVGVNGDTVDVECGPEVRNFNKLAVGDEVTATYTESYTIHVQKGGEVEETTEISGGRAPVGGTPGASLHETHVMKAKIEAIDKTKGTVTISTMAGNRFTVTPQNKGQLNNVAVGDLIVVTEKVGKAVSVTKPGAAKATTTKKASTTKKK
jgi:hypothetical protein